MWCEFEQSPVEDETISNAFSSRGIFKIQSGEEQVQEYPQVHAVLQNKKVVVSVDKSLTLLEDELAAKCSFLNFDTHTDAVAISELGNLIVVGLRDGAVHGIFVKGVPLFNLTINTEDINMMGRTFASIQLLDNCFHLTCSNGSIYRLSEINEAPLEANQNISLKGNETILYDESMLESVTIERIASSIRGLSSIESSVLIKRGCFDPSEYNIPLCVAGTQNAVYCTEGEGDITKITLPESLRGVKRILYLDHYILLLTFSGHLVEFCPITKTLSLPKQQTLNQLLIDEVIIMECNEDNIELLVLLKISELETERLIKFLEYPSFKCNSELEVSEHTWLVHQAKSSVNLYYLAGKQVNERNLPTEIEMILVSETHPSERFKKLISKGLLEEAESFGKQFELCLQPIYEAKAKRVLITLASLGDNNPQLLEQNFKDLIDILKNIESIEFFKNNRMINMPSRRTLERYLLEILKHLDEEKDEADVLEINEQLRRLETLTIIDPYEVNMEWSKFVYHSNLLKMIIALFKTDMPAACLIWKRHTSAMLPHLNDEDICKLLSLIPNHTEPFHIVQWLRQFVPTVSKTHPKLMPYFAEWCIQKTRTLQYAEHWPEIGLEFAAKVTDIFEEVQFMYCDVRRQHERNIAKLQDLVNALQDLSVLKKRYNLIFTLDNYLKDSIDETALCILQRVHLDNLRSLVNDFLYPIFQEKGKTPVEAIRQYISLLVINRNSLSTWLERAVACIELLHNENDRFECALMVLQRAPVPWPEIITNSLAKLRYSTHPLALEINAEYENQVIKIMKVKYGWPSDSNTNIHLSLFAQRIVKMQLPDMLDDIRVLIKAAPEVSTSANFNCCYQLVRSNKPELAYEYFKSLSDDKSNTNCMEVIESFADLLENCSPPNNDNDMEEQKKFVEFFKLIAPYAACRSVEKQLNAIQQRFVLCHEFRLNVNTVSELVPKSQRLQLLDRGIECIMDQSQATVNVPRFIFSEVAELCAALQLERVYGILHISRRIHCLPLTCALSYAVLQLVDCTPVNRDDFIGLALELLTQQILVLRSSSSKTSIDKDVDTLTFPIVYELLLRVSLLHTNKLFELSELLKYVQLAANSYPIDVLECYYVDKECEVNDIICKSLDVSEITLADTTLNFSVAQINDAKSAGQTTNNNVRYSVSVFDQIEVRPEQPHKKDNSIEQILIMKFVAHSIMLLLAETTPTDSPLLQLRTMLSEDVDKESVVHDFFSSLEKLIKLKMHDIWYIMVQYILEYQKNHECIIINTDLVSLHLARVFRNVMLNKDINFIDLFVMLIADQNKESLLKLLSNDLKTDQQRINLLTLSEMYNVHMEESNQVEAIRNKRLKQFYYMEFCKQDPTLKGKFNVDTDNIQKLLKLFHNKKLDVKLLERMSRDFNLDYQQMLITQVVSILRGQELKYEIKTDAFGEEELVVSTTVSGIRNLCHSYLPAIKNVEMMATRLIQFIREINIYFYELYLYVIEILSFFDKMPKEMHTWTNMLHFLKHKLIRRRRNRPGPLETDMWLQSQSEMGVMPKIARFRLPFITIVEQPLKDILDNELSVDNCESWFPLVQMHTALKGSSDVGKVRDYVCMSAVKNSIAEYKSKNDSEMWHLQPTNNAFLQSILRLVKHVKNPSKVFMILYFVSNYAPDGADQVEASYECYKYALAHEELIANEKHQDQLIKIKRKYPILKTQHLLYIYGLTEEKLLLLVENPTELIYSLYHHELILKSGKLDINTVAREIAELHSLNLEAIQFQLLQKWLSFSVNSNCDNLLEDTFLEDPNSVQDEERNVGNASENVMRANYILNSWPKKQAIDFLVAHIFPAEGTVNTSKQLQMYECFSKLNDGSESFKNVLKQKQYITIKCVHELKQLGYNSSLEKFTSCNKIDILKTIWQRNAQNPHTLEILANICLGFDIFLSKIWNGILKRMAMFNMVRELNALVDVLSCEPKLLHTEGLIVAWECVLWQPFKIAHQTRSFEQEETLQKALFRLQSCPIVHKLNLFEFSELCINLERPHMAAVAMALCRDVEKREKIKKLILPRKNEKMRKELFELEDAGLLTVILNFAQKELDI